MENKVENFLSSTLGFAHLFAFLKGYTKVLQIVDRPLEKIPTTEHFCWQFGCKCEF